MLFRQLFDRESSTYTYLIADRASAEAALAGLPEGLRAWIAANADRSPLHEALPKKR